IHRVPAGRRRPEMQVLRAAPEAFRAAATRIGRDAMIARVNDEGAGERFIRVVGRRQAPPVGEPPPKATRDALAKMAEYRTRAPKGVFIYRSHEEANRDRERWIVD